MSLSLCTLAIIVLLASAKADFSDSEFSKSLGGFSQNIFAEVLKTNIQKNVILSPFSIQTCLAMARMGTEGETAHEMDMALGFSGHKSASVAEKFKSLLDKYENSNVLKTANKVYVMEGHQLAENYKAMLSSHFNSLPEEINFAEAEIAARSINSWVEDKTQSAIQNLISPNSLVSDTRLLLLSAISFKGEWEIPFPAADTKEADFHVNESTMIKVPMMEYQGNFQYARLRDLKIFAARLPYKNSDLSMLVMVPFKGTTFAEMNNNLGQIQLASLKESFNKINGFVHLPKFKAEFQIELTDTLKQMGMEKMFSGGDFGKMFKSPEPTSVSQIVHKAFIEVTEYGTKAAAASGLVATRRVTPTVFKADQPFFYAIVDDDFVPIFQGTVVGF